MSLFTEFRYTLAEWLFTLGASVKPGGCKFQRRVYWAGNRRFQWSLEEGSKKSKSEYKEKV